jgi:rRNA maturation endonuclease Nob1
MSEDMFDSIRKAIRNEPQRCNVCRKVYRMKNTNVCQNCRKREDG